MIRSGALLIASRRTLVSAGTERSLVEFGKASWIDKARSQPDKVKAVLDKVKTDGLFATTDAVRSKLDQPLALGYCNVGVVLESDAPGIRPGARVVSNGPHAQVVCVPKNLCARIPDSVDDETAAFTVLAAIGLQGIRLVAPTLGEAFVVSGLGLIGLMAVQMLRANGCRVLGIDVDPGRCRLAHGFGAETVDLSGGPNPVAAAMRFSRGLGVDGVLVTASTESDEVIHQAAQMCRKRARVVLVGVVGLNLRRDDFYKKELTFQVSASYGPGRYDPSYEEKGHDYPAGFVRWTEQRNFEAVLDMMAAGTLDVKPLISHRFDIDDAAAAYERLSDPGALGILLRYPLTPEDELRKSTVDLTPATRAESGAKLQQSRAPRGGNPAVAFVGAGNYASRILIPAFQRTGARPWTIVTSGGVSGLHHGRKAGFAKASTDLESVWDDAAIDAVVIATRHDLHADQVVRAIGSGKHVFVEKPLAVSPEALAAVEAAFLESELHRSGQRFLMIGFNRRFAPHVIRMRALLAGRSEPKVVVVTVNAGEIPPDHWTQDRNIGGGRIVGEGCHFIDLARHLVGHHIVEARAFGMGGSADVGVPTDNASIHLRFDDGSIGTIHYLANGGKAFPKERVEVFCGGGVLQLDNYRALRGFSWPGFRSLRLWRQDKGQNACAAAFVEAIRTEAPPPIPSEEVFEVSRVTLEVAQGLP